MIFRLEYVYFTAAHPKGHFTAAHPKGHDQCTFGLRISREWYKP